MNNIKKLNTDIYNSFKDSNSINVILFTANWCDSCKMVYPVLEKLSNEQIEDVDIYVVDIDEEKEFVDIFQVYSIPTIVFTKGNNIYLKESGYRSIELIKSYISMIKEHNK